MPIRRSGSILRDSSSRTQKVQSDSAPFDEPTVLHEIITKSRLGASDYLRKIKEHLHQPELFLDFLGIVKDLKDGITDPPKFILRISENVQITPELVLGSVVFLPSNYSLESERQNGTGSFLVTMKTPSDTVPIRIVCRASAPKIGFFGHPGPTPKPLKISNSTKSSLKRRRSMGVNQDSAVDPEVATQDPSLLTVPTRYSKRLRIRRESEVSLSLAHTPSQVTTKPQKLTVAEVIQLFTEVLSSQEKYRRLLKYRGEKAQLVLDTLQALLDVPDIIPKSRLKLKKAVIKLSIESSLPPSCFSLYGLEMDDFAPSDEPDGNFGEIYNGHFHEQPLCIKIVKLRRKSNMDKVTKAFLKEGVIWSQINHPNILPFYGIYRLRDRFNRLSLVSPWLANGNVCAYLEAHPGANRLLLILDIIQGIAYLHNEGFVHGDIKGVRILATISFLREYDTDIKFQPNILVTKIGRACLADFGLATMVYEAAPNWTSLRSTDAIGGTLRWQAPEMLESEMRPTAEGDIYSFGCVMYEILTGQVPFCEFSQQIKVIKEVMIGDKRPARPPSTHKAWTEWGLTEEVWKLMEQCWNRDFVKRPPAKLLVRIIPKLGSQGTLEDERAVKNDEYLSPSAFRHAVHAKLNPLSEESITKVVQWLRE